MTLHNLDVGIALAVVMLGVSLLITILTQMIASILSTRGAVLQKSLTALFQTVYPQGDQKISKAIAEEVLRHPLISDSTFSAIWERIPVVKNFALATTVRAEELIGILDVLAPEGDPAHAAAVSVADAAQSAANAVPAPAAGIGAANAATAAAAAVSGAAGLAVAAAVAEARAQAAALVSRAAAAAADALARKAEAAAQTAGHAGSRTDAAKMVAKAAKGAVKEAVAAAPSSTTTKAAAEAAAKAVADAVQNHANTIQNAAGDVPAAAAAVAAAGRAAVDGAVTNATTNATAHTDDAALQAVNAAAQKVADAARQAIGSSAAAAAAGAPNDPAAAARAAANAVAYAAQMEVATGRHATIRALTEGARKVAPTVEAVAEQAKSVLDKVGQVNAAGVSIQIDNLLKGVPSAAEAILSPNIKDWFHSTMDRASQKFALQMRFFTVICSVVVAFALHLDTFRFMSQVSSDPELRAGLVNASQEMLQQAAAVRAIKTRGPGGATAATGEQPPPHGIFTIYREAMQKTADDPDYKSVKPLAAAKGDIGKQHFANREDAVRWLKDQLKGDAQTDEIVQKFQLNVDTALTAPEDQMLDHAASIRAVLGDGGFKLIPDPYHPWDFFPSMQTAWGWWPTRIPYVWPAHNLHFWGILFSAGLLSLGAPFWFNALKTLSSLRPVVANKEDQEQQGA